MELISEGFILRLFVIVSVFCLLGVNCSRMWSSFDKRQLSAEKKRCLSPCKIFHSWCKNDGKCREKGPDCSWYCECPDNCEGFFCEKVIENVDGKNKTTVKIKAQVVRETEKQTFTFDKSKLEQALASIYQKNKETETESGKPAEPKPIAPICKTIKVNENITVTGTLYCPPDKINKDLQNRTSEATRGTSTSTIVPKTVFLKITSSASNATSTKATSVTKISISELMRKNNQVMEGSKDSAKHGTEAAKNRSRSEAYLKNTRILEEKVNEDQSQTSTPSIGSNLSDGSGSQVNTTDIKENPTENVTLSVEAKRKTTTPYIENITSSVSSANSIGSTTKVLTSQIRYDTVTSQTTLNSAVATKKDEISIAINTTSVKPAMSQKVMSQTVPTSTLKSSDLTTKTSEETLTTMPSTRIQTIKLRSTVTPVTNVEINVSSKSMLDSTASSIETTTYSTPNPSRPRIKLETKGNSTTQTDLEPNQYFTSTTGTTKAFLHPYKTESSSSTTVHQSPLVISTELPTKPAINHTLTKMETASQTTEEDSGTTNSTSPHIKTSSTVSSNIGNDSTSSSTNRNKSSITSATTAQTPSATEISSKKETKTQNTNTTHLTQTSINSSMTSSTTSTTGPLTRATKISIRYDTLTLITHITPQSRGSSIPIARVSSTTPQTTIASEILQKNETTMPTKNVTSVTPESIRISTTNLQTISTAHKATSTTELSSKNETTTRSKGIDRLLATSMGNTKTIVTSATTTTKRTSTTELSSENETTTHSRDIAQQKTKKMKEISLTTSTTYTRSLSEQSISNLSVTDTNSTTNLSTTVEPGKSDLITSPPPNRKNVGLSIPTTTIAKQFPSVETTIDFKTSKVDIKTTTPPSTSDEANSSASTLRVFSTYAKPVSSTSSSIMTSTTNRIMSRKTTVSSPSYPERYGKIRSTTKGTNGTSTYSNTNGTLSSAATTKAVDSIKLSTLNTTDTTTLSLKFSTTTQPLIEETQKVLPIVHGKSFYGNHTSINDSSVETDSSLEINEQSSPVGSGTMLGSTIIAPKPKMNNSITEDVTTSSNPKSSQISTDSTTTTTDLSTTNISKMKTGLSNSVKSELKSTTLIDSKIKNIPLVHANNIIKTKIHETKKVVETIKQMELDIDKKYETDPTQNFYDSFFPGLLHSPESKENMLQSSVLTTTGKQV